MQMEVGESVASGSPNHKGIRNVLLQSFGPIPLNKLSCGAIVGRGHSFSTDNHEVTPSGFISHGTFTVILMLWLVYFAESAGVIFLSINF